MASRFSSWPVIALFVFVTLTWGLGCNKSSSSSGGSGNESFVVLGPPDVNAATGTLTDAALEKIKQAGNQPNLTVRMSGHASITDAALTQLAQFKNLHKVLAPSSRFTPGGIEKFKKALPDVTVEVQ